MQTLRNIYEKIMGREIVQEEINYEDTKKYLAIAIQTEARMVYFYVAIDKLKQRIKDLEDDKPSGIEAEMIKFDPEI